MNDQGPHRTIECRLEAVEGLLREAIEDLLRLLDQEERMSSQQSAEVTAMNEAITALDAELADVSSVDSEVAADLTAINEAVGKIGPVSPEQVNAVTAVTGSLASLTAKLKGAAGEAVAADVRNAPGPVSPPAAPAAPASGVPAESKTTEAVGGVAAGTAPAALATPTKPVYLHSGEGVIDPAVWPASGFETVAPVAQLLYYFASDVAGGPATGGDPAGVWSAYTGPVQAVPAPV
jgi:hypothetical protein